MPLTVVHAPVLSSDERNFLLNAIPGELEERNGHFWLRHESFVGRDVLEQLRSRLAFDVNVLPADFDPTRVRLLVTDMDSTLINIECIDEIADMMGLKAEVAAVTEAAMRGEIDFATSLTRRVSVLKGLDESALMRVYEERLQLNPGAEALIAGLKARGIKTAVVSGGFTFFTERLKARLGLDYAQANLLETEGGKLTGRVVGEIVDAEGKARFVEQLCAENAARPEQAIAMGDGANDLRMMSVSGLGVAYRAKPRVQAEADVVLNHGHLDAVLQLLA